MYLSHKNFLFGKILMTSFHVICGLDLPQSKILGTPINWRSPKKIFWRRFFFFFWRTLAPVSLVLGLGLEHSCPWPREVLSSERLSLALALASDFFLCPWPWPWPRALCPRLHLWCCPWKGCPWPRIFFVFLAMALASSLTSSTPPLRLNLEYQFVSMSVNI